MLENLKAVLEGCGSSLAQVVKTTVYLTDMREFAAMNEVYARYSRRIRPREPRSKRLGCHVMCGSKSIASLQ